MSHMLSVGAVVLTAGIGVSLLGVSRGWLPCGSSCGSAVAVAEAEPVSGMAKASVAGNYKVDPVHSSVHFVIRHAGVANFYGRFNELEGTFSIDPENPSSSSMSFTVNTASVDTNSDGRDNHLRSADFFNARQFPTATFTSTSFTPAGDGLWQVAGNFTLLGETRPVTARLDFLGTGRFRQSDIAAFEASLEIKRTDFGMTTYVADDGGEGGALGNTVTILLSVEGVRQ